MGSGASNAMRHSVCDSCRPSRASGGCPEGCAIHSAVDVRSFAIDVYGGSKRWVRTMVSGRLEARSSRL
jgi:hypothetical protein